MLTGFGRPGQFFVAVPTADVVNVNDPAEVGGEFDYLQVFNIFSDDDDRASASPAPAPAAWDA